MERTEGNLVNTYQIVIKPLNPEQPKQQITVIQNTKTKEVKVVDVNEISTTQLIASVQK